MNERKDVYQLPAGDTTLEWYSKAVVEMKSRPTADSTSWSYQAGIHGYYAASPFWKGIAKPLPNRAAQKEFWKQCQHGSWFFLPWHRMYLAYFEQIVAQTIVDVGGPAGWTLPFWNYSDSANPNALTMPPAFTNPNNATNGLWIDGRVRNTIPAKYVSLTPLKNPTYTGDGRTSPLGFGGPQTSFSHSGSTHGGLESTIHDNVHGLIGGAMGDPRTAGLDPIFWLHHANIDRLWQVWLNMGNRTNPTQSAWLNFKFNFHDKSGNIVNMICSGVENTTTVLSGYTYQGVAAGAAVLAHAELLQEPDFSMPLEITAATNKHVALTSQETVVHLKLTPSQEKKANFAAVDEAIAEPKTSILHFENVTGKGVPPLYDVYLNLPAGAVNKESYFAGAISFFGVEEASTPNIHQSGSGQHYALNVTELMNQLRSLPNWNEQQLDISMDATRNLDNGSSVTIGRISLYSE